MKHNWARTLYANLGFSLSLPPTTLAFTTTHPKEESGVDTGYILSRYIGEYIGTVNLILPLQNYKRKPGIYYISILPTCNA